MRARKFLLPAGLASFLILSCLTGCQGADSGFVLFGTPSPSPVITPVPTPSPVPVIALAGSEHAPLYAAAVEHAVKEAGLEFALIETTALESTDGEELPANDAFEDPSAPGSTPDIDLSENAPAADSFANGAEPRTDTVQDAGQDAGMQHVDLVDAINAFEADGAASIILYCESDLPELARLSNRYPVFLCAATRQTIPQGVSNLCYDQEMAPAETLQLAFDYPPHLAPVRMLGLFVSEESDAFQMWEKAVSDGLVMDRGVFLIEKDADDAQALAPAVNDWITARMKKLYPGMLDCVYAETGALAVHVANSLLALNRMDAELFAAATDSGVCALMEQHPALIANVVGMDIVEAASVSVQSAVTLLSSQTTIERSLTPQVYPAATAEP